MTVIIILLYCVIYIVIHNGFVYVLCIMLCMIYIMPYVIYTML